MWDFHPDWLTPIETLATAPEAQAVPFDERVVSEMLAVPAALRGQVRAMRRRYAESQRAGGDEEYDFEDCDPELLRLGLSSDLSCAWVERYFGEPDALARLDADEQEEERRANS